MAFTARKPKVSQASSGQSSQASQSIEDLRVYYHSVHDSERSDVIELLGSMREPNAARELISLYGECEWRTTKLQIIRVISQNPTDRALQFLFRLAQEPLDIPIAETAIWSLGQSHHPLAARFLVRFYNHLSRGGSEYLKPAIVGAIGQLPDHTLAQEFVAELQRAIESKQPALIKNLVLTLGELKVKQVLPTLFELASDPKQSQTGLASLVALGKIARDPHALDCLERRFRDDPFEYQLYSSVKTQVQFRSQWRLEDYLARIFEASDFHRTLPFELGHFKTDDVREGFKLFVKTGDKDNLARLCTALGKVDFPGVADWYAELIDFGALDETDFRLVLESIASHLNVEMRGPLLELRSRAEALGTNSLLQWVEALSLALPDPEEDLKSFFRSDRFRHLTANERTRALNGLINFGLTVLLNGEKLQSTVRLLENVLEEDQDPQVQARALRGIGSLGQASKKALNFAREKLNDPALTLSSLNLFEQLPEKAAMTALLSLAQTTDAAAAHAPALLRALCVQAELPNEQPELDKFLKRCLKTGASSLQLEALRLLGKHPRKDFIPELVTRLAGGSPKGAEAERMTLAAIISLKANSSYLHETASLEENAALTLGKLLYSPSQSLSGRALDTLTALRGMKAKRVVIEFLRDRVADSEVCDKIFRCLEAPSSGGEYFTAELDDLLKLHPRHPQLDGLISLREKMASATASATSRGAAIKGADINTMDRTLSEKIASYASLDDAAKTALRSAELPFLHPEMYDEYVDKSGCLVGYCKAIDIQLERCLGKKHLFPKLENSLHEFHGALHAAGLGEDFPSAERVIAQMGIEKHFNAQSLPLHKMGSLAQSIRNGRIVNERFKTLDGLRAWAIILMIFGRKFGGISKPLLTLKNLSDDQTASLCRRLMALQDIRNPAAHRQTVVQFKSIDDTRSEALALLNMIQKAF